MDESNAEKVRRLREQAKAEGRCSMCRARPARPYRLTCQDCSERVKKTKRRLVASGLCGCGAEREFGKTQCRRCIESQREYHSRLSKRRKSMGRCVRCGWVAAPGVIHCRKHARENSERSRAFYNRKVSEGLCPWGACKETPDIGHVFCRKHLDQMKEQSRERRKEKASSARVQRARSR